MVWTASTYERRLLPFAAEPSLSRVRRSATRLLRTTGVAGWRLRVARAAAIGNAAVLLALAATTWPWMAAASGAPATSGSVLGVCLGTSVLVSCLAAALLAFGNDRSGQLRASEGELFSGDGLKCHHPPHSAPEASLNELVDRMRHDLRTPLNAVIGFSDMMQQELLGPLGTDRYQGYAGHIRDSGLAVLKVAEDTLALTRLLADLAARGEEVPVDLDGVVSIAIGATAEGAQSRGLRVAFSGCGGIARGDPRVLERTLKHLLPACFAEAQPNSTVRLTSACAADQILLTLAVDGARPGGSISECLRGDLPGVLPLEVAAGLIRLQGGSLDTTDWNGNERSVLRLALPAARP